MFEILLGLSVALLIAAVAAYRAPPAGVATVLGLGLAVGFLFVTISARSLFLIYPALLAAWVVCRRRGLSRSQFAAFGSLAVLAAWGVAAGLFLPRWKEAQRLAADYPVVRMDQRLAYERPTPSRDTDVESRFPALPSDQEIEEATGVSYAWTDKRASALATLERTHDSFVDAFTEQEAFGFLRMIHMPPRDEYIRLPEPEPVALAPPPADGDSAGAVEEARPITEAESFREFHSRQALDFVNPEGFGVPLEGEWQLWGRSGANRVRGFQPHAFGSAPEGSPVGDEWQLTKLELVSLLKHDPPAAYVSEHLPRMQELAAETTPTRPLDGFETASLAQLRDGRTVVADESRNRIRMLGGLRAAERCAQCHSVSRGELLGAFSYEFRRKAPLPAEELLTAPKPIL